MATEREIDRLIKLASKNLCEGVREEPRLLFDRVPLDFTVPGSGGPNGDFNSYVNGERWPLRITNLVLSLGQFFEGQPATVWPVDPSLPIQMLENVDLRIRHHDIYYMAEKFLPVPIWQNKVTSVPSQFGNAASSWTFDRPCIMSARDQMYVTVQALFDQVSLRNSGGGIPYEATATLSFTGVGVQSQRPYFFGASVKLTDSRPTIFAPGDLQNVGLEPVAITDMSFQTRVTALTEDGPVNVPSDVRAFALQVRQIGNGTNANWFGGPSTPTPLGFANASLIGVETGPAIVHRLPGDGILLEPGEGFRIDAQIGQQVFGPSEAKVDFFLGAAGYLVVT